MAEYHFVIVPVGIPALGKSTLIRGTDIEVVSSDKTREQCMLEYMQKTGCTDHKVAFEKTRKQGPKVFFNEVKRKLGSPILFLDKNHPPNAIEGTLQSLKGRNIVTVMLKPACSPQNKNPLSLSLLLQCMVRCRDRTEHETLKGELHEQLEVVLMMYNLYKNTSLDSLAQRFDYCIEIPFTNEDLVPDSQFESLINHRASIHEIAEYVSHIQLEEHRQDIREMFLNSLHEIIRNHKTAREPVSVVPAKAMKKMPVFLGINVENTLSQSVLTLIHSVLEDLNRFYDDNELKRDYEEISGALSYEFNGGASISENWKFPNSLHLTTLFVGGNKSKLQSEHFKSFQNGAQCTIALTHIAYSPKKLVCAKAVIQEGPLCANENPHITLLLSEFTAKMSNDILGAVTLTEGHAAQYYHIKNKQTTIYTYKLHPDIVLVGHCKAY